MNRSPTQSQQVREEGPRRSPISNLTARVPVWLRAPTGGPCSLSSSRRVAVVLLLVVNVALAAALLSSFDRGPAAFAQTGLTRGQFLTATAKASGFSYDVLYVIDLADHRLHAFYPGIPKTNRLVNAPSRDLMADFAKEQQP